MSLREEPRATPMSKKKEKKGEEKEIKKAPKCK